jgi:hypothetical protein
MTLNTQTVTCMYSTGKTATWSNNPITCVPVSCYYPPPANSNGSLQKIIYSPNTTTNRQYQTTITFLCPANQTLPQILSSNFSFDYNVANGMIYNVTAFCEIDR